MGQAQETLDHAHALHAAGLDRRLGPAGAVGPDQPGATEQPGSAAFHAGDLLRGNVISIGAEPPRLVLGMDRDLVHFVVEHAHHAGIPANPDATSQVLRRDRVVGTVNFDVAVAMDVATILMEEGESLPGQRLEQRPLHLGEKLAYLLARGAVQPGVGDGAFPVKQKQILLFEVGESSSLQAIVLNVSNAAFDLALVLGLVGSVGQHGNAVMIRKRAQLGIEVGVEPVSLLNGRFEVVEDETSGHTAEMIKGILKGKNEVLCSLPRDGLAIGLAGIAQYDPQDMGLPPLAIGTDQWRTGAEVNLS